LTFEEKKGIFRDNYKKNIKQRTFLRAVQAVSLPFSQVFILVTKAVSMSDKSQQSGSLFLAYIPQIL